MHEPSQRTKRTERGADGVRPPYVDDIGEIYAGRFGTTAAGSEERRAAAQAARRGDREMTLPPMRRRRHAFPVLPGFTSKPTAAALAARRHAELAAHARAHGGAMLTCWIAQGEDAKTHKVREVRP